MVAGLDGPHRRPPRDGSHRRWRRALRWVAVSLGVVIGHALVIESVDESLIGWGAADRAPRRLEVAFVKALQQAKPRVEPAPSQIVARAQLGRAPQAHPLAAVPAARAASAGVRRHPRRPPVELPASAAEALVVESPASAPEVPPTDVSSLVDTPLAGLAATAPAPQAAASGPTIPIDDWPPSTRLRYTLTGNYRGAIGGTAEVRWVRVGTHYQVQMDVTVGLPFAPLMTRRVTSDGQITDDGLRPEQFDELTKRAFQPPYHVGVRFDRSMAWMSNGNAVFALPGTQDSASQFVQLTWLFTLHPELLQPGRRITFPLALQGRVTPWVYEVGQAESLYTIFGDVPVVHVSTHPQVPIGRVLAVECWFAPTLQYLPARILVRESDSTYIDLVLDRLPMQALPASAAAAQTDAASAPPRDRKRSL